MTTASPHSGHSNRCPRIDAPENLRFLPPNLPEAALIKFVERTWDILGNLKPLAGERDQNFCLTTDDGARYVLKIGSPMEDLSLVDYQVQALLRIESRPRRSRPAMPSVSCRGGSARHCEDSHTMPKPTSCHGMQ